MRAGVFYTGIDMNLLFRLSEIIVQNLEKYKYFFIFKNLSAFRGHEIIILSLDCMEGFPACLVDYMVLVGSMALGFMDLVASMVLEGSMAWEVLVVDF